MKILWSEEYADLLQRAAQAPVLERIISALADQVQRLRDEVEDLKGRTDNAVDELLAVKGMPPISPVKPIPLPDDNPWEEDRAEVDKWRKIIQSEGLTAVLPVEGV